MCLCVYLRVSNMAWQSDGPLYGRFPHILSCLRGGDQTPPLPHTPQKIHTQQPINKRPPLSLPLQHFHRDPISGSCKKQKLHGDIDFEKEILSSTKYFFLCWYRTVLQCSNHRITPCLVHVLRAQYNIPLSLLYRSLRKLNYRLYSSLALLFPFAVLHCTSTMSDRWTTRWQPCKRPKKGP